MHKVMFVLSIALAVGGCAGFGLIATSNPLEKLMEAEQLLLANRPMPAERMIREAMTIYAERGDRHGLGAAHASYGDFLSSDAVEKWAADYRRSGFQDKSVSYANRLEKASEHHRQAIEHYRVAEPQHIESGKFDHLSNLYLNMGKLHVAIKQNELACSYFDKSFEAYRENIRRNPSVKPWVVDAHPELTQ